MAATQGLLEITVRDRLHAACIVPDKRLEQTTDGGLDAAGQFEQLAPMVSALSTAGIRVSLFIEPDPAQIDAAIRLKAPVVEFHTRRYAHLDGAERNAEVSRLSDAAAIGRAQCRDRVCTYV